MFEGGLWGFAMAPVRGKDGLLWAEQRLTKMGFEIRTKDRIRSYEDDHDSFVVFADPREEGRITFKGFRKPTPKKTGIKTAEPKAHRARR